MVKGRKRKPNVRRTSKGAVARPARSERAENMQAVVIAQRVNHFGLSPEQAKAQLETGILARLRIVGDLDGAQHDALVKFAADYRRAMVLLRAPRAVTGTDVLAALIPPAPDPDRRLRPRLATDRDVLDQRDIDRYVAADIALQEAGRQVRAAVYAVAVEGIWAPHYGDPLKSGAKVLAKVYGYDG